MVSLRNAALALLAVVVVVVAFVMFRQQQAGPVYPVSLHSDFAQRPSGVIEAGDEGAPFVMYPTKGPYALRANDGVMTVQERPVGRGLAAYAQQTFPAVRTIGADFRFGPGKPNGSVALVLWSGLIPVPYAVPDSPLHFVITPRNWIFGIWQDHTFVQLRDATFTQPLRQDATTTYSASATIEGDTVTLTTPDGVIYAVQDPRIAKIPRRIACWEVYTNDSSENLSSFVRTRAS